MCDDERDDPDEGRILLDGRDLRDYDLEQVYANVSVIFQDFTRYDFRLWENIGVGCVERIDDKQLVAEASRRSRADSVAARLVHGFDQQLGRRFDGGVELSGGEWQKVALARAYMRNTHVLILDEPTAALDARGEHEVFARFTDLAQSKSTLVISHRFSTVRMAHRIVVLKDGSVVEEGEHEALISQRDLYVELFNLQAVGYG